MHSRGEGLPKDDAEAVKWLRKAADQGHAEAQYNLGQLYRESTGVPQDYAQAASWFRKAADQGNIGAQNNLGGMYENGWGVPKDDIEAYAWYNLAAVSNVVARKNRDNVARRLPSGAQLLAQQRSKQLQQQIENREIERLKKADQKQREKIQKGA
jgi:TPR repeat protein